MAEHPIPSASATPSQPEGRFARRLGLTDLVILGVGSIMGTGVFVVTGTVAAHTGPAVMLSFVLAALCAGLAALCYAEMAGMAPPVVGSAYLYAALTLGRTPAFLLGWILALIYMVGAALLAVGWSGYATSLIERIAGHALPPALTTAPVALVNGAWVYRGLSFNLPALSVVLCLAVLLNLGLGVSARLTTLLVAVKVGVVALFIAVVGPSVDTSLYTPLVPPNRGTFGEMGVSGVLSGAMTLFFAYMGFDAVSAAAAEAKRPHRDLPLAILLSLGVCAALYVATAAVLVGVVPYESLDVPHPLAVGASAVGASWLGSIIDVGALFGLSSVLMAQLYVQPRIVVAMAQDGLLPRAWGHVDPRRNVPTQLTLGVSMLVALAAALLPVSALGDFASLGILAMFLLVSLGVMRERVRHPERARSFVVPGGAYLIPGLSVLMCAGLMLCARTTTQLQMLAWLVLGALCYRPRTSAHPH